MTDGKPDNENKESIFHNLEKYFLAGMILNWRYIKDSRDIIILISIISYLVLYYIKE